MIDMLLFALGSVFGAIVASLAFFAAQRMIEPYRPLSMRPSNIVGHKPMIVTGTNKADDVIHAVFGDVPEDEV